MTTSDARKRNRDMADAHATARARDARVFLTGLTMDDARKMRDAATAIEHMASLFRPHPSRTHPITQENPMNKHDRHDELVALLRPIRTSLVTAIDTAEELLGVAYEIRDRLPERVEARVAPFDPDVIAANLEAVKHEVETPMRGHGECCEPADITEEPPCGSQVTDREGDVFHRFADGWTMWDVDEWGAPGGHWANIRHAHAPLRLTTDEDRERVGLPVEPAPADVDPDEALASVLWQYVPDGDDEWAETYADESNVTKHQMQVLARVAREHIAAEQEDAVAFLREEVESLTARAEKAEGVCAILEDRVKFWQEEKRLDNDAELSYLARAKEAEDERGAQAARAEKAEAERDAKGEQR